MAASASAAHPSTTSEVQACGSWGEAARFALRVPLSANPPSSLTHDILRLSAKDLADTK